MATIRIYKRNSTFIDLSDLVEQLSKIGLNETLTKYDNKPTDSCSKGANFEISYGNDCNVIEDRWYSRSGIVNRICWCINQCRRQCIKN